MPTAGSSRSSRRGLVTWAACTAVSGLLLAAPQGVRDTIATVLEWSLELPVRVSLGWSGSDVASRRESRRLQRDLVSSRLEIVRIEDAGRENQILRRMLGMRERSGLNIVPATVVGRSIEWPGEVLWVEVSGETRPGTAVVTAEGLLGRVARVSGDRARVETLWHSRLAVSVLDARSREQGILHWDPARPSELSIDPVPLQSDFRVGDPILTSGLGEIFPRGIRVGHVLGTDTDVRTQLKRVRVRPAVHRGRAQDLFLVQEKPPEADASALFPDPEPTPPGPLPLPGGTDVRP